MFQQTVTDAHGNTVKAKAHYNPFSAVWKYGTPFRVLVPAEGVEIGNNVTIEEGATFSNVTLADDVFIGQNCQLSDVDVPSKYHLEDNHVLDEESCDLVRWESGQFSGHTHYFFGKKYREMIKDFCGTASPLDLGYNDSAEWEMPSPSEELLLATIRPHK